MKRPALLIALMLAAPAAAAQCDAVWRDGPRGRDVPVRIDLPAGTGKVPAVLWSPGLGGTRASAARWATAWRAAGIAVIRMEHPGSDAGVYRGAATPQEREARVRAAIASEQVVARIGDVGFVADELARRRSDGGCDISRIDIDRLALAGHSMGAWVVQAMAGEFVQLVDRRFRAFIAMSTSGPTDPATGRKQFAGIGRPVLVITGSEDGVPPAAAADVAAEQRARRISLFMNAPADGRKALLVLAGADHMLFAGDTRKTATEIAMQSRVAAVTSLWWRQWLRGDARAGKALAKPPLGKADKWQRK